MTETQHTLTSESRSPAVSPDNYSSVTVYMEDSIGAIFLGILAVIMLIGWRRAEMRYRSLAARVQRMNETRLQ